MIFTLSRPVSCKKKKQQNGSGKQGSLHAPLNSANRVHLQTGASRNCNEVLKLSKKLSTKWAYTNRSTSSNHNIDLIANGSRTLHGWLDQNPHPTPTPPPPPDQQAPLPRGKPAWRLRLEEYRALSGEKIPKVL